MIVAATTTGVRSTSKRPSPATPAMSYRRSASSRSRKGGPRSDRVDHRDELRHVDVTEYTGGGPGSGRPVKGGLRRDGAHDKREQARDGDGHDLTRAEDGDWARGLDGLEVGTDQAYLSGRGHLGGADRRSVEVGGVEVAGAYRAVRGLDDREDA